MTFIFSYHKFGNAIINGFPGLALRRAEVLEKGLSLSEINVALLKKIEELTLYVIEMQKQIELLKTNKK